MALEKLLVMGADSVGLDGARMQAESAIIAAVTAKIEMAKSLNELHAASAATAARSRAMNQPTQPNEAVFVWK